MPGRTSWGDLGHLDSLGRERIGVAEVLLSHPSLEKAKDGAPTRLGHSNDDRYGWAGCFQAGELAGNVPENPLEDVYLLRIVAFETGKMGRWRGAGRINAFRERSDEVKRALELQAES